MQNYIIDKNTIAVLKHNLQTIIYDVENIKVINKNIKKVLDENCNFYGSSLVGRKKYSQKYLQINYKVPLIISEFNNIILIQINALRDNECLFIVLDKIKDYYIENDKVVIKCVNGIIFKTNKC